MAALNACDWLAHRLVRMMPHYIAEKVNPAHFFAGAICCGIPLLWRWTGFKQINERCYWTKLLRRSGKKTIIIALPNDVIKMNKHLEDYRFKIDYSHETINKMLINILSYGD